MPKLDDETYSNYVYAKKIFTEEGDKVFYQGRNPCDDNIDEYLNNLAIDMKKYLAEYFPMFDFELLMKSIVGESCGLIDEKISFQCSNPECGYASVCSAYALITDELIFDDWHHR